ncbi:MAG: Wzz/FepE/Etk N-terminal domain-containing protein [Chloroflexi bacterium]|nr:Wzz/FepE/Etk N-terminal domain-containing protein [Chloroflexota bacterium]
MSIQSYLRILGARKKLIFAVTLVAFLGSVLLALLWPNAYESTVRVHVQPVPPPAEQGAGFYYSQEYYRQIIAQYNIEDFSEIVRGRAFATSISEVVAERYGLQLAPKVIEESLTSDHSHRILEITLVSGEARVAQALADAAQTVFETKSGEYSPSVQQGLVRVKIVDPASDPEATSLLRLGLDVFARTLVAILLITGIAFVLEVVASVCRSREDIEEVLRVPILTTIPPIAGQEVAPAENSDGESVENKAR